MMLLQASFLLTILPSVLSHCDMEGLRHCALCSDTKLNCSDSVNMTEFPALQQYGINHTNLVTVIFKGQNIPYLGKNALGNISHNLLDLLDLSNNGIQMIDPGAFHYMKNLKTMILDDNEWAFNRSTLHPRVFNHTNLTTFSLNNAFLTLGEDEKYTSEVLSLLQYIFVNSTMQSLTTLKMARNQLYGLPTDFFVGMPNLEVLDLSHNSLELIQFQIQNLTNLKELHLAGNHITTINMDVLDDISELYNRGEGRLKNVTLGGNPINCDCTARDLRTWLESDNGKVVTDVNDLYCDSAPTDDIKLKGDPLVKVDLSKLVCKKIKKRHQYLVLGIVMGLVGVVALIILFLNRSFFLSRYLACKETLGSKREFSVYSAAGYNAVT